VKRGAAPRRRVLRAHAWRSRRDGLVHVRFDRVGTFILDGRTARPERLALPRSPSLSVARGMATWMARGLDGELLLHGSSVRLASKAVAFLARSGGGKSTLAYAFVRRGASLLSDDVLPVRPETAGASVALGTPLRMRMAALAAYGIPERRTRSAPGRAYKREVPVRRARGWVPLAAFYFLRRRPQAAIRPLPTVETLAHLVRHLGFAGVMRQVRPRQHFEALVDVASKVPGRLLHVPNGIHRIDEVVRLVQQDLRLGVPSPAPRPR
jgi:hypothetical protein